MQLARNWFAFTWLVQKFRTNPSTALIHGHERGCIDMSWVIMLRPFTERTCSCASSMSEWRLVMWRRAHMHGSMRPGFWARRFFCMQFNKICMPLERRAAFLLFSLLQVKFERMPFLYYRKIFIKILVVIMIQDKKRKAFTSSQSGHCIISGGRQEL